MITGLMEICPGLTEMCPGLDSSSSSSSAKRLKTEYVKKEEVEIERSDDEGDITPPLSPVRDCENVVGVTANDYLNAAAVVGVTANCCFKGRYN